ncbi:MAG: 4-(cytidine 5'-diphospho)-2-C-methyl-D-erythritol kinase [Deltaproteobacteria bacterium]|nr:MAG: 4-(cytidine 5'-diphospho)-2-C-methyl-D-erythritol kinase [Deltaproteobacteria bacterium]
MTETPTLFTSPAKINLFLAVTGRRPGGYHELFTLMCPLALSDTLKIEQTQQGISVCCADPDVPGDGTNLAYRAAQIFLSRWVQEKNGRPFGVRMVIKKRIPVAAGLGGGSSNAATVLLALNRVCENPFSRDRLMAMALKLGADVPFFILRCPAIATGIGEILEPVAGLAPISVLLVHPSIRISTADVYRNLKLRLTKCQQRLKNITLHSGAEREHFRLDRLTKYLCNDLETVTVSQHPFIETIKQTLIACGAAGALMSGSGPTVFGLFRDKAAAQDAFIDLSRNRHWQVFKTELVTGASSSG